MLDYALSKARQIPYKRGQQRHFCIITDKRGRILAESANSYTKSSPKMKQAGQKVGLEEKIFWHAECKTIYSVRDLSKAHRLIVVRIGSKGEALNSKPCCICERLIQEVGIKEISYSTGG